MLDQRIYKVVNKIYQIQEYRQKKRYPDIWHLIAEVKPELEIQLITDFDDNTCPFFMNLSEEEKLQKYSEFMYDMYLHFYEYPGIDIVSKWRKEYNKEIERRKVYLGIVPANTATTTALTDMFGSFGL